MRVTRAAASVIERGRAEVRRSFEAALARVREDRAGRRPGGEGAARASCGRAAGPQLETAPVPGAPAAASATWPPPGPLGAAPALPELREAARAIPPAIWSGKLEGEACVELSFGRDLSVELRKGPAGIEIAVRTRAALTRAVRADLPALVRTLSARGVVVARAELRGGPPARSRAVDARAPLR